MNKLLFSFFLILCFGFTSCQNQPGTDELITEENASAVGSYDSSDPQSVVMYYFASRIRGDDQWKEVMMAEEEWNDGLQFSAMQHNAVKFTQFQNRECKEEGDTAWLKVFFEIEMRGRRDSGEDDISLKKIDGEWVITSLPI